jgi:dihydropteroate synthase
VSKYVSPSLTIRGRLFEWGSRTYVMGIVNLSPESFSGDGLSNVGDAVQQAKRFVAEGADIIDVGGQSTRPNFDELSVEQEIERVVPAVRAIAEAVDLPVSIDAYRVAVVEAALRAGANIVNDIWGLRHDPAMARLVAGWGVPAIAMHNQRGRAFHDVIGDIRSGFEETLALAHNAGLPKERIILDPGFGFGWSAAHSLEMLRRLAELRDLGLPLLIGTSRKSALGAALDLPERAREWGTAATVALAIANGADIVRVHNVQAMAQVARMTDAVMRAGS